MRVHRDTQTDPTICLPHALLVRLYGALRRRARSLAGRIKTSQARRRGIDHSVGISATRPSSDCRRLLFNLARLCAAVAASLSSQSPGRFAPGARTPGGILFELFKNARSVDASMTAPHIRVQ